MITNITIQLALNHHRSITNKELKKALDKLDFIKWSDGKITLSEDGEIIADINDIKVSISEM